MDNYPPPAALGSCLFTSYVPIDRRTTQQQPRRNNLALDRAPLNCAFAPKWNIFIFLQHLVV
jgi:hypothetical protein